MDAAPVQSKPRRRLPRKQYLVLVEVKLNKPMEMPDAQGRVRVCHSYLRNFGVTATSLRRAMAIVERRIDDGEVYFDEDSREIDLSQSDAEFAENCKKPNETGVWYASTRAFIAF